MSYRCQACKKHVPAPSTPIRLVVEYRTVTHTKEDGKEWQERQIAKETTVCVACGFKLQPENEEVLRRLHAEKTREARLAQAAQAQ
jgi:Zn ribbon nucleic-acid-binding protein